MVLIERIIISLMCIIMYASAYAENYFCKGTTWEYVITNPYDPTEGEYSCFYELHSGDDSTSGNELTLSRLYSNISGLPERLALIRTEEAKVWFSPIQDNPEWMLMYDFDIKPNERVTVTSASRYISSGKPETYNLECLAKEVNSEGLTVMTMGDVYAGDNVETDATGRWLVGIGAMTDLLDNCRYNADGNTSNLKQIISNGKVIYQNPLFASVSGIESDSQTILRKTENGIELSGLIPGEQAALFNAAGIKISEAKADGEGKASFVAPKGISIVATSEKTFKATL